MKFPLQINICVDYIKPPSDGYPEKTCATVTIGTINVAEALISKGIICSFLKGPTAITTDNLSYTSIEAHQYYGLHVYHL
jgi:hypothetical protein